VPLHQFSGALSLRWSRRNIGGPEGGQVVGGSNPLAQTNKYKGLGEKPKSFFFSG
jgi:hypothetical protein